MRCDKCGCVHPGSTSEPTCGACLLNKTFSHAGSARPESGVCEDDDCPTSECQLEKEIARLKAKVEQLTEENKALADTPEGWDAIEKAALEERAEEAERQNAKLREALSISQTFIECKLASDKNRKTALATIDAALSQPAPAPSEELKALREFLDYADENWSTTHAGEAHEVTRLIAAVRKAQGS